MFAIGTEIHLVNRLAKRFAEEDKPHHHASTTPAACAPPVPHQPAHLAWAFETLVEGPPW